MQAIAGSAVFLKHSLGGGGGGGRGVGEGVSELMDRWGCAILALEVVPKSLIFAKNPTQKFISRDFMLAISARKTKPHNISSKDG